MKVTITSNEALARFGRMDAGFMSVADVYADLITELLDRFKLFELRELALKLPEDRVAINIVWPPKSGSKPSARALRTCVTKEEKPTNVAVYVAIVAQCGASKILAEIERIADRKIELAENAKFMLSLAQYKEAPLLSAVLKSGGLEKLVEVKQAEVNSNMGQ